MKTLVLALLVLVVGVEGWAEPIQTETMPLVTTMPVFEVLKAAAGQDQDGMWHPIQVDRDGYVMLSLCLAKMEAAMRAMEPFLDGTRHIDRPMTEPERDQYFRDRVMAYQQWYAVSNECWRHL